MVWKINLSECVCVQHARVSTEKTQTVSLYPPTLPLSIPQTRVPAQLAYLGEEDYQSFINPSGRCQEAVSLGSRCCFYYSSLFIPDNAPTHMQSGEMCGVQS